MVHKELLIRRRVGNLLPTLKFGVNNNALILQWHILAGDFHRSSSQSGFSQGSVWTCSRGEAGEIQVVNIGFMLKLGN